MNPFPDSDPEPRQLPPRIDDEAQLEDVLSRPSRADIAAGTQFGGDVVILGAGGKMGPSLARRLRRAVDQAGARLRVIAVSRFSDEASRRSLLESGVEVIAADLLERDQVERLPDAPNVIFMAGRKFGSTGAESLTWAMNAIVPALIAERYRSSRIAAFSSGNIYPLVTTESGGCTEECPPGPVGEYAQSVLARERILEHYSGRNATPMTLLRLNYAVELRYGVLLDIGTRVYERKPVQLGTGFVNVIWQGDANSVCLRSLQLCTSPPALLNMTGPEILSVREIASRFGQLFGITPVFEGKEAETALLNNASRCHDRFGRPSVPVATLIEWTAHWIRIGGPTLNKPTHFEARDGKF
jgi:nucleoside-diphosphate-sugar epimerase